MPELPEAETMRRYLSDLVAGSVIRRVEVLREASLKGQNATEFRRLVEARKIISIGRRGKALIVELSGQTAILFRLGMSGRLIYQETRKSRSLGLATPAKHERVIFHFSLDCTRDKEEGGRLAFQDLRAFGRVRAFPEEQLGEEFKGLGIEPLGRQLTSQRLQRALGKTRIPVKVALMDQSRVCGIGNIYASEILHRCRVHPARSPQSLSEKEWKEMAQAVRQVLHEAVEAGGTSVSDYLRPDGSPGSYQNHLRVYGRDGKPCYRCGAAIVTTKQRGRSSFHCPSCQPATASC